MSKETGKVFVSCALGAGIGSLVALELNQWLWWIGLIAGGLTGYLSYEFKKVFLAIIAAWKATAHPSPLFRLFGWQVTLWLSLSFLATLVALTLIPLFANINTFADTIILMLCVGILAPLIGAMLIPDIMMSFVDGKTVDEQLVQIRKVNRAVFPFVVIFWHMPRGLVWLVRATSKFLARFCWQVFIRIHSEMRLLCMADAALGAAVGYFIGSAIIGALAGGIFGLINYAVVTKRILEPRGLLPAR